MTNENVLSLLVASYSKDGKMTITKTLKNIELIVKNDDRLAGKIKLNLLTGFIEKFDLPFGDGKSGIWTDSDDTRLGIFIFENYKVEFSTLRINEVVKIVAEDNCYHPVKNYLSGLKWDGVKRVESLLCNYFGAEKGLYSETVSRITLLSGVARILNPGCKVDTVTILEGEQGIGKSTGLRALAGVDWFKDDKLDIENMGKDTLIQLSGVWLYELGELASLRKAEADSLKSFISKQIDTYRPPYGRSMQQIQRQLIFIGTVNPNGTGYLKDTTGNRRYLPIKCGKKVDVEAIKRDRDQIWAEAVFMFNSGEKWHWEQDSDLDKLIRNEVAEREDSDMWLESIAAWLNDKNSVTIQSIWEGVFEKKIADLRKPEQTRIGGVLKSLGWSSRQVTKDGVRLREYSRTNVLNSHEKLSDKVMAAALEIINEQCHNLNSVELEKLKVRLNRAHGMNKDIFDVADKFGENFNIYLKSGKEVSEAFNWACNWLDSFLASAVTI